MKRALIVLIAVGLVGCGGGSSRLNRDQQQYDVVEEGSASGVTSTINAPGETTPPITGTNADTTTAFTLPMGGVPTSTGQPGTIAGTLPTDTTGGMVYPPGMPRPVAQPRPRPVAQPPVQQQPPMTSAEQQPQSEPQPQPAQPSTQPPPPPETTTQAPPPPETTTAPPPEKKDEKKKDDQQEQESPPDEQPAPPPPTQTFV